MYKSRLHSIVNFPTEEWRDIIGYDGIYQVSNYGRVNSLCNNDKAGLRKRPFPVLRKLKTNSHGRLTVRLCMKGYKDKMYLVHILVAEAFLGHHVAGKEVNHKDGDPKNNHVNNLEWVTASENIVHAFKSGLMKNHVKGNRVWCSKLNESDVLQILHSKDSSKTLSEKYSVATPTINSIRSGRIWNHVTGLPRTRATKSNLQ